MFQLIKSNYFFSTKINTGGSVFQSCTTSFFFRFFFTDVKKTGVALPDVTLVLYFSRNNSCDDLRTKFYTGGAFFKAALVRSFFNGLFTDVKNNWCGTTRCNSGAIFFTQQFMRWFKNEILHWWQSFSELNWCVLFLTLFFC